MGLTAIPRDQHHFKWCETFPKTFMLRFSGIMLFIRKNVNLYNYISHGNYCSAQSLGTTAWYSSKPVLCVRLLAAILKKQKLYSLYTQS